MSKSIKVLLNIILFLIGCLLIVKNQKVIGWVNLGLMIGGLSILLLQLFSYNKKYK